MIERTDFPALYENNKGEFTIVPDWKSGPVGFFRSSRSLEEYEAEEAAAQSRAIARAEEEATRREAVAREEGAAVRAAIVAREEAAAAALARRKQAALDASGKKSEPAPAGDASPSPLAGFFKASE